MATMTINHQTIGELDEGRAGAIIDAALRDAVADLEDRGAEDGKARKVTIVIELKLGERDGTVDTHVECGTTIPKRRTASHLGKIKQGSDGRPKIVVQQYAPDNPEQRTLDEMVPGQQDPRD